jgi:hypothetical protein
MSDKSWPGIDPENVTQHAKNWEALDERCKQIRERAEQWASESFASFATIPTDLGEKQFSWWAQINTSGNDDPITLHLLKKNFDSAWKKTLNKLRSAKPKS